MLTAVVEYRPILPLFSEPSWRGIIEYNNTPPRCFFGFSGDFGSHGNRGSGKGRVSLSRGGSPTMAKAYNQEEAFISSMKGIAARRPPKSTGIHQDTGADRAYRAYSMGMMNYHDTQRAGSRDRRRLYLLDRLEKLPQPVYLLPGFGLRIGGSRRYKDKRFQFHDFSLYGSNQR